MYLQDHTTLEPSLTDGSIEADHSELDEVGGRALEGGVDGVALGIATDDGVRAIDVGEATAALQEGGDIAALLGFGDDTLHIARHARVGGEVAIDELLGFLAGDGESFAQTEGGDAVDDAEVGGLGSAAHIAIDLL